jgi:hypothetical protein
LLFCFSKIKLPTPTQKPIPPPIPPPIPSSKSRCRSLTLEEFNSQLRGLGGTDDTRRSTFDANEAIRSSGDLIGLVDGGVDFTRGVVTSSSLADDASSEGGDLLAEGSGGLDPDGIPAEGGEDFAVFAFVKSEDVGCPL